MDAPSGSWPLSAATTAVLQNPKITGTDVMKLALKELVLRRAWRIERLEGQGWRGRGTKLLLRLGDKPVPPLAPLPLADAAVRRAVEHGRVELREAVAWSLNKHRRLPDELRDDAREELVGRGLVEVERRKVLGVFGRTVVTPTLSGRSWAQEIGGRQASVRTSAGRTGAELGPQVASLGGLVLLLDPDITTELSVAIQRFRGDAAAAGHGEADFDAEQIAVPDSIGSLDLDALDGLDSSFDAEFDSAMDSAIDAGVSDGGGDGGGGDGGS